jgi:hypothetical protein
VRQAADQQIGQYIQPWRQVELLEDHRGARSPITQCLAR